MGWSFFGSIREVLLWKKILVCPPADSPSHCELASWEVAALGSGGGARQKGPPPFPFRESPCDLSWPLMEVG